VTILVIYGTIEGHTAKIAREIATRIEQAGHQVVLTDAREPGYAVPGTFDAVIVCGSIHYGRYPEPIVQFAKSFKDALNNAPSALVTVSLAAASEYEDERQEASAHAYHLSKATGWVPNIHHSAAGAIKFLEFSYFKRLIARHISAYTGGPLDDGQDYELTDWPKLNEFVSEMLTFTFTNRLMPVSQ